MRSPQDADLHLDHAVIVATVAATIGGVGVTVPDGHPTVAWDQGMEAWQVGWPRLVGGVPVPTDFVAVWIYPGGQVKAITDIKTPLDVAPASLIPADAAIAAVRGYFDAVGATSKLAAVGDPVKEWRQPNAFVDPSQPAAPASHARMVWAVPYTVNVAAGEQAHGVLWVDAGSGKLVGGSDVS